MLFSGAQKALLRLQQTYNLKTEDIAIGHIRNRKGVPLTTEDYYQLGQVAKQSQNYALSVNWFQYALDDPNRSVNKSEVLINIADAHFIVGDYEKAAELARDAEKLPKHSISKDSMHKINSYKAKNASIYRQSGGVRPIPVATVNSWKPKDAHIKQDDYERLCNDENEALNYRAPSAFCHIRNSWNYYSWAKEEVFLKDPFVAIIHDVISDKELEVFKELGKHIIQPISFGMFLEMISI